MKKILLLTVVLMLLVVPVAFAEEEEAPEISKIKTTLKIGADVLGDAEVSVDGGGTGTLDVDPSLSFSAEITNRLNPNIDAGIGVTFQMPRSIEDGDSDYYFIPIYGLIKFYPTPEQTPVYLIGQAGYNFLNGDDSTVTYSGGIYYGIGAGFSLNNKFQLELLYSSNNGTAEGPLSDGYYIYDVEADMDYSKITLSAGISF